MNYIQLFNLIKNKRSFLCVGLDSDIEKIPSSLMKYDDPVFEFNKRIIDATLVMMFLPLPMQSAGT